MPTKIAIFVVGEFPNGMGNRGAGVTSTQRIVPMRRTMILLKYPGQTADSIVETLITRGGFHSQFSADIEEDSLVVLACDLGTSLNRGLALAGSAAAFFELLAAVAGARVVPPWT